MKLSASSKAKLKKMRAAHEQQATRQMQASQQQQAVQLVSLLQETLLAAANVATLLQMNGRLPHVRELLDKDLDFMFQVDLLSQALELDTEGK